MAEEPLGDQSANDGAGGDDPVVDPRTVFGSHNQKTPDHGEKNEDSLYHPINRWLQKVWEGTKGYLIKLRDAGPDRHIELLLAFAIVFFAARQYSITKSNSESSTEQMKQIITAADRINDAADSFSGSAAQINDGIRDAVGQLQLQVNQSQRTATAAERSVEQAKRALADQSSPVLVIVPKVASAKTIEPNKIMPEGERKSHWQAMKLRQVALTFAIHNLRAGPAIGYEVGFIFLREDNLPLPAREFACGAEINLLKNIVSLQTIDGGRERTVIKIDPNPLHYDERAVRAIGCVAYKGVADSLNAIHTMAIVAHIRVGPNNPDARIPPTAKIESYTEIPTE